MYGFQMFGDLRNPVCRDKRGDRSRLKLRLRQKQGISIWNRDGHVMNLDVLGPILRCIGML